MPASTSARNIVIVGAVLLLGSGMWFYYANEKAKAEKQIAERMLQLIETEQQRKADLEEQRQQARSEELRQRVEDAQRRRFEMDSQRAGQMVDAERRRIEAAAAAEERRNAATLLSDERNRESARRQAEGEALRRVADEKRQLREICVQRYRRADC